MAVTPPNFTQIPNDLLDKMADMTPAEFKVLMAICRKTFGWRKSHDVISLSQLEEMTGLSRTAVQAGIMAGMKRGVLERTKSGKQSFCYHLLVVSDYQSTETTSSPKLPKPVAPDYQQLVVSDYTQKKELNKGNKDDDMSAAASTFVGWLIDLGVTKGFAINLVKKNKDATIADWSAWMEECKADNPLGLMLQHLKDGRGKPPQPRTNGKHTTNLPPAIPEGQVFYTAEEQAAWQAERAELLRGLT